MDFLELSIILLFLLFFSIISFKKNLLNFEGIMLANVVGLAAITYGPSETTMLRFFAVVVFFIIGEIASNFPKKKHEKEEFGMWLEILYRLCLFYL